MSRILAFLFHPALYPVFVWVLYSQSLPIKLSDPLLKFGWIVTAALVVLPIAGVLVLWGLGMVEDPYLKTARERRVPILISVFAYLMAYRFFQGIDALYGLSEYYLGLSIGLGLGVIFQEIKPSLHMLAAGAFLAAIVVFKPPSGELSLFLGIGWTLFSGLLGMSRIKEEAHNHREVFLGFSLGFFPILILSLFFGH